MYNILNNYFELGVETIKHTQCGSFIIHILVVVYIINL